MALGENIRKIRRIRDITQETLAREIGFSQTTVASWEKNRAEPSIDTLVKMSHVLDCPINELIGLSELSNSISLDVLDTSAANAIRAIIKQLKSTGGVDSNLFFVISCYSIIIFSCFVFSSLVYRGVRQHILREVMNSLRYKYEPYSLPFTLPFTKPIYKR